MPVHPVVFDTPDDLGAAAAELIADRIAAAPGRFLLGCPGGRSPLSTYRALARLAAGRRLDLSGLVIVMMDDYLADTPQGRRREDTDAAHSCERFARLEIVGPLNDAVGAARRIAPDALWLPDPADPAGYDRRLSDAGGVDLFLLASGASDGHIAFNPPGSARTSRTRVVELPDSTRRDNLGTFPSFGNHLDRVPRAGVTVGIDTIAAQSRSVLMLLHSAEKGQAARRLLAADRYQPDWPATVLAECRDPHFFLDRAAASAAQPQYL